MNTQINFMITHLPEMRQLAQRYMEILAPAAVAGAKLASERFEILSNFNFMSFLWGSQLQAGALKLDVDDINILDDSIAVLTTMEPYYKQFKGDDLLNFIMLNNALGRAVTLL